MLQVATRLDRSYIDKGQKKEEKRESTHHLKSDSLHQFWNKSKRISLLRSSRRPCHASTAVVVGEASISDDVRGGGMGQGERALPSSPVSLFRREEGRSDGMVIALSLGDIRQRKEKPACPHACQTNKGVKIIQQRCLLFFRGTGGWLRFPDVFWDKMFKMILYFNQR